MNRRAHIRSRLDGHPARPRRDEYLQETALAGADRRGRLERKGRPVCRRPGSGQQPCLSGRDQERGPSLLHQRPAGRHPDRHRQEPLDRRDGRPKGQVSDRPAGGNPLAVLFPYPKETQPSLLLFGPDRSDDPGHRGRRFFQLPPLSPCPIFRSISSASSSIPSMSFPRPANWTCSTACSTGWTRRPSSSSLLYSSTSSSSSPREKRSSNRDRPRSIFFTCPACSCSW